MKKKDLLIYDVSWWILGSKARTIQQYHPNLDIMSINQLKRRVNSNGSKKINDSYETISTLSLGIAQQVMHAKVRVDSSQIASYQRFSKNAKTYREWCDSIEPNHLFIKNVIQRIDRLGGINRHLAQTVEKLSPVSKVSYMRHFVDCAHFTPLLLESKVNQAFTIGWCGDPEKPMKNYASLYKKIQASFLRDPNVQFVEAVQKKRRSLKEMPAFYNSLDLLLITSSNEGGPAPALEAYACGIPVLSTNVGYVKEVASPLGKQFILNSIQPEDFIKKINELKKDQELLKKLKKETRKNIITNWSVEERIDDWLQTLFLIKK
ncbi:glycosyltransferase [Salipaludibacillus sp. HK11]|uniref:glycosyltransferase n=1 Tax=Salipaludibacillus sp. HK11 TaxID=3394320 RepID=UPI0039FBE96B